MRYLSFILSGAALLVTLSARAELVSGVQVVVNDSVITVAEIEDAIEPKVALAAKLYGNDHQRMDEEIQKLHDQQLEQLVERKLIVHEFVTTYSTNVLEAFIDDTIQRDIQRTYNGDRARLIQTLQAEGRSMDTYRRQERENFIVQFMVQQNISAPKKVLISPLKIERYYNDHKSEFTVDDQVHIRMIALTNSSTDNAEAKKLGAEILAKVDAGVPFAEMASIYSAGSQRAKGGDYGWVDRKFLNSDLADVAFSLKAGQHSGVIELPGACYLIMVEETRPSHTRSLTEMRSEIERTLKNEENVRLRVQWVERLKKKSYIRYY